MAIITLHMWNWINMRKILGWVLFLSSFVFFGIGIWVVAHGDSSYFMVGLATALAILSEVTFWLGGTMIGIGWIKKLRERKKQK